MTDLPDRLKVVGIRFVLVERGTKKPFQPAWQTKNIEYDNPELLAHLAKGGNYGIMGGGNANLLIVDFDDKNVQDKLIDAFPKTFTVQTGSGMIHKYFLSDQSGSFKIFNDDMRTLVDVQGEGKQAIGPGSIHPNGTEYKVIEDLDIAYIPYPELKALLLPFDRKPTKKSIQISLDKEASKSNDSFVEQLIHSAKMEDVLSYCGVDTSRNPTACPFHASKGGKCFSYSQDLAHCFHCDGGWNALSFIKQIKNYESREAIEKLAEITGMQKQLQESREKYKEEQRLKAFDHLREIRLRFNEELYKGKEKRWGPASEILVEDIKSRYNIYTTLDDEKSEVWIYEDGIYTPQGRSRIKEIIREIMQEAYGSFLVNLVISKIEADTFIESNKFFSMNNKDEVPVMNGILNIRTRTLTSFSPERVFFNKLPVTYDPLASCPEIDTFLGEVLANEEDRKIFYEIAGFGLLKEYRYEKAFMLVGFGRNGKGKSISLLKHLVGPCNCTALPLASLNSESFSVSELFGKFFNLAGDIGNADLKDTAMFKGLTGRDPVTSKRKFLRDITFENYAKFVFACNELPMVYDLSRGFWDRWILLDFPYTFVTKEEYDASADKSKLKIRDDNVLNKLIVPSEMSGFLNKALDALDTLIKNKRFSSTKGTEEIKNTWIQRSNSFIAFCMEKIEEDFEGRIRKRDLRKEYLKYCKTHKVGGKGDFVIKKVLQEMFGSTDDRVLDSFDRDWYWSGIRWKN